MTTHTHDLARPVIVWSLMHFLAALAAPFAAALSARRIRVSPMSGDWLRTFDVRDWKHDR